MLVKEFEENDLFKYLTGKNEEYSFIGEGGFGCTFKGPFNGVTRIIKIMWLNPEIFENQTKEDYDALAALTNTEVQIGGLVNDVENHWVKTVAWGKSNQRIYNPDEEKDNKLAYAIGRAIESGKISKDSAAIDPMKLARDLESLGKHAQRYIIIQEVGTTSFKVDKSSTTDLQLWIQKRDTRVTKDHVQKIMFQLSYALYTANARYNVVHNDLKPPNIVIEEASNQQTITYKCGSDVFEITFNREDPIVTIIDLGAAEARPTITQAHQIGDPSYAPPPADRQYEPRVVIDDMWSVGMIGFILATAFNIPKYPDNKKWDGKPHHLSLVGDIVPLARQMYHMLTQKPLPDETKYYVYDKRGIPTLEMVNFRKLSLKDTQISQIPDYYAIVETSVGKRGRLLLEQLLDFNAEKRLHLGLPIDGEYRFAYAWNNVLFHPFFSVDAKFYKGSMYPVRDPMFNFKDGNLRAPVFIEEQRNAVAQKQNALVTLFESDDKYLDPIVTEADKAASDAAIAKVAADKAEREAKEAAAKALREKQEATVAEEAARLSREEAARLVKEQEEAKEEAARLVKEQEEAARLAKEEAARLTEKAVREKAEAERAEKERQLQAQEADKKLAEAEAAKKLADATAKPQPTGDNTYMVSLVKNYMWNLYRTFVLNVPDKQLLGKAFNVLERSGYVFDVYQPLVDFGLQAANGTIVNIVREYPKDTVLYYQDMHTALLLLYQYLKSLNPGDRIPDISVVDFSDWIDKIYLAPKLPELRKVVENNLRSPMFLQFITPLFGEDQYMYFYGAEPKIVPEPSDDTSSLLTKSDEKLRSMSDDRLKRTLKQAGLKTALEERNLPSDGTVAELVARLRKYLDGNEPKDDGKDLPPIVVGESDFGEQVEKIKQAASSILDFVNNQISGFPKDKEGKAQDEPLPRDAPLIQRVVDNMHTIALIFQKEMEGDVRDKILKSWPTKFDEQWRFRIYAQGRLRETLKFGAKRVNIVKYSNAPSDLFLDSAENAVHIKLTPGQKVQVLNGLIPYLVHYLAFTKVMIATLENQNVDAIVLLKQLPDLFDEKLGTYSPQKLRDEFGSFLLSAAQIKSVLECIERNLIFKPDQHYDVNVISTKLITPLKHKLMYDHADAIASHDGLRRVFGQIGLLGTHMPDLSKLDTAHQTKYFHTLSIAAEITEMLDNGATPDDHLIQRCDAEWPVKFFRNSE